MNSTAYDNALNALHASQAHTLAFVQRRHERLGGTSGFYKTLQKAHNGDEATAALANAQIAAAYESSDREEEALKAEHNAVAALFALLDEADIRRMIDTFSHELRSVHTINWIFIMLGVSRNLAAVKPLVERLEAPVIHGEPLPSQSRFSRWLWEHLPDSWTQQSSDRATACRLDRMMTLHALGRLGGERAEAAIRPFLANADDDIRKAAQQALVLIETQSA